MSGHSDDAPATTTSTEKTGLEAFGIDTSPLRDPAAIAARDQLWLERVYNRTDRQLTLRSALMGMALGAVLSVSDLYIGLKVGWIFGMSITSSILAFAIFAGARKLRPGMREFSMLENNTSQTAASAAAYMASAGLVSSFPAMAMLRREGMTSVPELTGAQMTLFLMAIASLGVMVAIPVKRSMINAEQLRFPSGVLCAETIRTLHRAGGEAMVKARALIYAGLFSAALKFVVDCRLGVLRWIPRFVPIYGTLHGRPLGNWSIQANTSLLLYAAGSIAGIKVAASMMLAAVINFAVIGPWLVDHGVIRVADAHVAHAPGLWSAFVRAASAAHALPARSGDGIYVELRAKWSVWPGTAVIVTASMLAFAFRWRTVARAFSGIGRMLRPGAPTDDDPLAAVEVPGRWFAIGLLLCTVACVYMQSAWFGVPIALGVVSVAMAFVLSIVAARATGETNITPIGAMGKITQLLFGVLVPGNVAANLMTATVTAGAAAHSADLLTEVKTGYLLGGAPRKQFWAQLLGVLAGSLACVPIYQLLARPERLGRDFAAPSAVAWAAVARLLKDGVHNLPRYALPAIAIGAGVGAVLAILDEVLPASAKRFLPSATGMGIALVIDFNDSFALFVGAVVAVLFQRVRGDLADRYQVPVASGIVAGEGLMGIAVIAMRDVLHWLPAG